MSMIRMEFTGQETVSRAQRLLAGIPNGITTASKSAAQRAASYMKTNSTKAIRERYAIPAADVKANERVTVSYSYANGVQVFIKFAGKKISLSRYNGSSKASAKDVNSLVRARVSGGWRTVHPSMPASGHQLTSTAPTRFQNAFVARMRSGHVAIFERTGGATGSGSDEIKSLMGTAPPQMLGNEEVTEKLAKATAEKFEERLEHEVLRILNGWGG